MVTLLLKERRMITDFKDCWKRICSASNEDGIIEKIFEQINTTNKYFVEFGATGVYGDNTGLLKHSCGWSGLWLNCLTNTPNTVKKEYVTAENINELFKKYNVPDAFDLLSIDIDFNDYWVWKAIASNYRPRVVIIEYNAHIPANESKVVEYELKPKVDGSDYFGASLLAMDKLAKTKKYTLVGCDRTGSNAFFVVDELIAENFNVGGVAELYQKTNYWPAAYHFSSKKKMVDI